MKYLLCVLLLLLTSIHKTMATELVTQAFKDYDFQLEKYREEYRSFDLKRNQYQNLQTFGTLEELVQSSKILLVRRDEVWQTYFQAIRLLSLETYGFDQTERQSLVQRLQKVQQYLKDHQILVNSAKNREELLKLATEINQKNLEFENLGYETLSLINFNRLKYSIDQLKLFNDQIVTATDIQIRDVSIRDSRIRGLREMRSILDLASQEIETIRKDSIIFGKDTNPKNSYDSILEDFAEPFSNIQKCQKLADELSQGIEL